MAMPKSRSELMEEAAALAADLSTTADFVERNAFLSLVSGYLADGDSERLQRTVKLVAAGSGGHLKRSGSFSKQVKVAAERLGRLLDERQRETRELQELFGWTARLLKVRRGAQRSPAPAQRQPAKTAPTSAPTPPPPKSQKLGALGKKDIEALAKMKERLNKGS
jgi:hypothetical protein